MKGYRRILVEGAGLLCIGGLLFAFPEESLEAAREGITLCLDVLIPSLFPFFVLSSLLIETGVAGLCARPLSRWMYPLFGVGGAGAAALMLGLIGGYPAGARTIAQLVERGECSREEARRLSRFCNNCGPAFVLGAVGMGVFGSKEVGFLLLGANLGAAVLLGVFFARGETHRSPEPPPMATPSLSLSSLSTEFPGCVHSAFSATLGVCSYVILFSVLTALADCSGLLPACIQVVAGLIPGENVPVLCRSACMGFLEISTGTAALQGAVDAPGALPLAAFLLGWGGLSVHCQSLPFWRAAGVRPGPYLRAKFLQGMLAAGITMLASACLPLSVPAMAPLADPFCPGLFHQEVFALFVLAGVSFLRFPQKRVEKTGKDGYNRRKR